LAVESSYFESIDDLLAEWANLLCELPEGTFDFIPFLVLYLKYYLWSHRNEVLWFLSKVPSYRQPPSSCQRKIERKHISSCCFNF
jgi:hypothetical protein